MSKPLKVGIIGASAERGWAKISHVPAVQALAGLELAAVATNTQASADAAAKAFGVTGYADGHDLIHDPAVDIVTIAVKVPDHHGLLLAALAAGKHVYCEWPLGCSLRETAELAMAARDAGVKVAIGLQTRGNPAVRRARELIAHGAIGRVLSARVVSTTMAFGRAVEGAMAFAEKAENGVTLVTIQGAHTIDTAVAVLGEFADASALATTQYGQVEVAGAAGRQARSTPDHVLVQARLANGAALSLEIAGGRPPDATPYLFEITGETGMLALQGGAPRGFQSGRLRLLVDGADQMLDEGEAVDLPDTAANVAGLYAALRDDIRNGTAIAPDFEHATRLSRLLEDLMASSQSGVRRQATDWPGCDGGARPLRSPQRSGSER